MRSTLFLAVTAILLVAADAREDGSKRDLKKLSGTWVLVTGEVDGKKIAAEHVEKSKITWVGNKAELFTPHQSKETIRADITLDPTRNPPQMDWVRATEPGRGKKFLAVYEFQGDDQYRVCFSPAGQPRPKDFKTAPGSGHIMHVWKRARQ